MPRGLTTRDQDMLCFTNAALGREVKMPGRHLSEEVTKPAFRNKSLAVGPKGLRGTSRGNEEL